MSPVEGGRMRIPLLRLAVVALVVVAAAAVVVGGCGKRPPGTEVLGHGASQVTIRRPAGDPRGATVIFLHGWGGVSPNGYRAWIQHLVDDGHVVVFPRYQVSGFSLPSKALPNAVKGIRTAFDALGDRRPVVVVGHSAGGALAFDYAAMARESGLPVPAAVMAVYPGGGALGLPAGLPQGVPRSTRVLALASEGDHVAGTGTARKLIGDTGRGRLVMVKAAGATDHLAPTRDTAVTRRVFWQPLDALLQAAG
jgi:pimeloyl-ACP methyl ester carboxylesterase